MTVQGLHHITLVAADAQRTVDFYTRAARPAPGQADGQLRRSGQLSSLLRRRAGAAGLGDHLLRVAGRAEGCAGHRRHAPFRADGGRPRRAAALEAPADRPGPARQRAARPPLLHVDLLQRPGRHDPRDRHARAGLDDRRGPERARAGVSRAPRRDDRANRDEARIAASTWPEPVADDHPAWPSRAGMHHITAISWDIERTDAFFGELLGMRRVKMT